MHIFHRFFLCFVSSLPNSHNKKTPSGGLPGGIQQDVVCGIHGILEIKNEACEKISNIVDQSLVSYRNREPCAVTSPSTTLTSSLSSSFSSSASTSASVSRTSTVTSVHYDHFECKSNRILGIDSPERSCLEAAKELEQAITGCPNNNYFLPGFNPGKDKNVGFSCHPDTNKLIVTNCFDAMDDLKPAIMSSRGFDFANSNIVLNCGQVVPTQVSHTEIQSLCNNGVADFMNNFVRYRLLNEFEGCEYTTPSTTPTSSGSSTQSSSASITIPSTVSTTITTTITTHVEGRLTCSQGDAVGRSFLYVPIDTRLQQAATLEDGVRQCGFPSGVIDFVDGERIIGNSDVVLLLRTGLGNEESCLGTIDALNLLIEETSRGGGSGDEVTGVLSCYTGNVVTVPTTQCEVQANILNIATKAISRHEIQRCSVTSPSTTQTSSAGSTPSTTQSSTMSVSISSSATNTLSTTDFTTKSTTESSTVSISVTTSVTTTVSSSLYSTQTSTASSTPSSTASLSLTTTFTSTKSSTMASTVSSTVSSTESFTASSSQTTSPTTTQTSTLDSTPSSTGTSSPSSTGTSSDLTTMSSTGTSTGSTSFTHSLISTVTSTISESISSSVTSTMTSTPFTPAFVCDVAGNLGISSTSVSKCETHARNMQLLFDFCGVAYETLICSQQSGANDDLIRVTGCINTAVSLNAVIRETSGYAIESNFACSPGGLLRDLNSCNEAATVLNKAAVGMRSGELSECLVTTTPTTTIVTAGVACFQSDGGLEYLSAPLCVQQTNLLDTILKKCTAANGAPVVDTQCLNHFTSTSDIFGNRVIADCQNSANAIDAMINVFLEPVRSHLRAELAHIECDVDGYMEVVGGNGCNEFVKYLNEAFTSYLDGAFLTCDITSPSTTLSTTATTTLSTTATKSSTTTVSSTRQSTGSTSRTSTASQTDTSSATSSESHTDSTSATSTITSKFITPSQPHVFADLSCYEYASVAAFKSNWLIAASSFGLLASDVVTFKAECGSIHVDVVFDDSFSANKFSLALQGGLFSVDGSTALDPDVADLLQPTLPDCAGDTAVTIVYELPIFFNGFDEQNPLSMSNSELAQTLSVVTEMLEQPFIFSEDYKYCTFLENDPVEGTLIVGIRNVTLDSSIMSPMEVKSALAGDITDAFENELLQMILRGQAVNAVSNTAFNDDSTTKKTEEADIGVIVGSVVGVVFVIVGAIIGIRYKRATETKNQAMVEYFGGWQSFNFSKDGTKRHAASKMNAALAFTGLGKANSVGYLDAMSRAGWAETGEKNEEFPTFADATMASIAAIVKLTVDELQALTKRFQTAQNSSGDIQKEGFLDVWEQIFPGKLANPSFYADMIFSLFDPDHDGNISVEEYTMFLALASNKSIKDKLDAIFRVADLDNNGTLSLAEVVGLIRVIATLNKNPKARGLPPVDPEIIAENIFMELDADENGDISLKEWRSLDKPDNEGLLDDVLLSVFGEQKEKRIVLPEEDPDNLQREAMGALAAFVRMTTVELETMAKAMNDDELDEDGKITREEFAVIWDKLHPNTFGKDKKDTRTYRDQIFRTFDKNDDGFITSEEYITFLAIASMGTISEKLDAVFRVFDIDKSGSLSVDELTKLIRVIVSLDKTSESVGELGADNLADMIFMEIDADEDGEISREEWLKLGSPGGEGILDGILYAPLPLSYNPKQAPTTSSHAIVKARAGLRVNNDEAAGSGFVNGVRGTVMTPPSSVKSLSEIIQATADDLQHVATLMNDDDLDEDGMITRPEFAAIWEKMHPGFWGVEGTATSGASNIGIDSAQSYRDKVFQVFDANGDGIIKAAEYMSFLAIATSGTNEEKLRAVFKVFDIDNNGTLDIEEVTKMIDTVIGLDKYDPTDEIEDRLEPDQLAEMVFQDVDADGDGVITMDEWCALANENEGIMVGIINAPFESVEEKRYRSSIVAEPEDEDEEDTRRLEARRNKRPSQLRGVPSFGIEPRGIPAFDEEDEMLSEVSDKDTHRALIGNKSMDLLSKEDPDYIEPVVGEDEFDAAAAELDTYAIDGPKASNWTPIDADVGAKRRKQSLIVVPQVAVESHTAVLTGELSSSGF